MECPFYNDFVQKNKYSRPAILLLAVKGIIIHYTANKGATAEGHQDYFDGSDGGGSRYAGAHIFVDHDSAVCIIPLNEVGYHANDKPSKVSKFRATSSYYKHGNANLTTIGIEMCIEKDGSFHPETVKRTQAVVKYLMKQYGLSSNDVYRHYDITGKICPKPYVDSPTAWNNFKKGLVSTVKPVSKPVAKPVKKPASGATATYKVVRGDYLGKIAPKFDMTVKELKSLNGLKSDLIKVGQVLKVKAKAPKLLTVKASSLFTYNTANWNDKGVLVKKGEVFTITKELTVAGSKMYQIKSGLYITANPEWVSVK